MDKEIVEKIILSIQNVMKAQESTREFMQTSLEANQFLSEKVITLEAKVALLENATNFSNIIPTTEVRDVNS
mgnify:FL=1|tara:strand:- start:181 stop:396 length:216 start_codon:yes stop_codon:yes gene_type:complete